MRFLSADSGIERRLQYAAENPNRGRKREAELLPVLSLIPLQVLSPTARILIRRVSLTAEPRRIMLLTVLY